MKSLEQKLLAALGLELDLKDGCICVEICSAASDRKLSRMVVKTNGLFFPYGTESLGRAQFVAWAQCTRLLVLRSFLLL